jgi:hypothetical protein
VHLVHYFVEIKNAVGIHLVQSVVLA